MIGASLGASPRLLFVLLMAIAAFSTASGANELPHVGSRYQLIRPIYLMAEYDNLNRREVSREAARFLHAERYYDKSWVAFQTEVPVGTIMTTVGPAPKVWRLPFLASRYHVRLQPDPLRELDVLLELGRGVEGNMGGLNPEIFRRLE